MRCGGEREHLRSGGNDKEEIIPLSQRVFVA
jgi:hypothetical protein